MRTPKDNADKTIRRGPFPQPALSRLGHDPAGRRIVFNDGTITIWGWPSRGGVIALERATALDFEFLGLDAVDLAMSRDADQDTEDALCQRLLLLGAKWLDSSRRRAFVAGVAEDDDRDISALDAGEEEPPNRMERRWVSVAFEPESKGGFWVADFDTAMRGMQEKHNLVPEGAARVQLARTMSEKVEILKRIGARFYASLDEYSAGDGAACLNAWST